MRERLSRNPVRYQYIDATTPGNAIKNMIVDSGVPSALVEKTPGLPNVYFKRTSQSRSIDFTFDRERFAAALQSQGMPPEKIEQIAVHIDTERKNPGGFEIGMIRRLHVGIGSLSSLDRDMIPLFIPHESKHIIDFENHFIRYVLLLERGPLLGPAPESVIIGGVLLLHFLGHGVPYNYIPTIASLYAIFRINTRQFVANIRHQISPVEIAARRFAKKHKDDPVWKDILTITAKPEDDSQRSMR